MNYDAGARSADHAASASPPPSPLKPLEGARGLMLPGGRYRLDHPVATGGRATVWKGLDTETGRQVAVKLPHASLAGDLEAARLFRAEALAGARVTHSAVVQTIDYHEIDSHAYLVLEFVEGKPLNAELRDRGTMLAPEILTALAQVAGGLHAVHRAQLVHRDVTPQNIVWDGQRAKLIDFGIAVPFGTPTLTANVQVPGNPSYLAPELALGSNATPAADIYSLGLVLLVALTGTRPFAGATPEDIAMAHVMGPSPVAPQNLVSDLRILIHRMTAKEPLRRPSSALVVSRLLAAFAPTPYAGAAATGPAADAGAPAP